MNDSNEEVKKKSIFDESNIETLDFTSEHNKDMKSPKKLIMPPDIDDILLEEKNINEKIDPIKEDLNKLQDGKIENAEEELKKQAPSLLNRPVSDDELLGDYVGNNYYKISSRFFNLSAIVFSSIYLFYRKMILFGLLVFAITILMLNFISNPYFAIIPSVLLGLIFNKLYLIKANVKIEKNKLNNKGDTYDLKNMCEKSGGTSLTLAVLGLIAEYGIIFGLVEYDVLHNFTKLINDTGVNINIVENFDKVLDIFNGNKNKGLEIISDDTVLVRYDFNVKVPPVFKEGNYNNEYTCHYVYSNDNSDNGCIFKLEAIKNYDSPLKLLNDIADHNRAKEPIPNGNWYYISYNSGSDNIRNYSINKNDKVYLMTFTKQSNAPSDCDSYFDEIYNAINLK